MLIQTVLSTFRSVPRAILSHTEVRLCCRRRVGCALPARAPTARLSLRPVGHPGRRAVARPHHCGTNQHKRRNSPQPRIRFGQTHVMLICLDKRNTAIKRNGWMVFLECRTKPPSQRRYDKHSSTAPPVKGHGRCIQPQPSMRYCHSLFTIHFAATICVAPYG
jgi:hypothetical protein